MLQTMRALGRQLEIQCRRQRVAETRACERQACRTFEPPGATSARQLLNLHGLVAVYKPPFWVSGTEGDHAIRSDPALNIWLQGELSAASGTITHDVEHSFGFVHRLDKPSSGVLLATTKFDAYYMVSWQLTVGSLAREYALVLQSLGRVELVTVKRKVPYTEEDHVASRTRQASIEGKPSCTTMRLSLQFRCDWSSLPPLSSRQRAP